MKYRMYSPQAIFETGKSGNQEDSIYPVYGTASADDRLFIVCDGQGSSANGNVASKVISNSVASYMRRNTSHDRALADDLLNDALDHACQELARKGVGADEVGTTFALLYLHRGGVTAAYIGDTRIYQIRPEQATAANGSAKKGLLYVSPAQSGGQSAEGEGGAQAKSATSRLILANSTARQRLSTQHFSDVRQGDYFVICTRGMLEHIADEDLVQLLSERGSDEKKRKQLLALTADNHDNHSAYILHIENVMAEAGDDDYSSASVGSSISYGRYASGGRKRNYGHLLKYLLAAVLAVAVIYLGYDYFSNRPATAEPKSETVEPDSTLNATQQQATDAAAGQQDTIAQPATAVPQTVKPVKTTTRSQEEQSASSWLYDNSGSSPATNQSSEPAETKPEQPATQPAATPEPSQPAAPVAPQPAPASEGGTD